MGNLCATHDVASGVASSVPLDGSHSSSEEDDEQHGVIGMVSTDPLERRYSRHELPFVLSTLSSLRSSTAGLVGEPVDPHRDAPAGRGDASCLYRQCVEEIVTQLSHLPGEDDVVPARGSEGEDSERVERPRLSLTREQARAMAVLRQLLNADVPDAIMERILNALVRRRLLSEKALLAFGSVRFNRIILRDYGLAVTNEWVRLLLAGYGGPGLFRSLSAPSKGWGSGSDSDSDVFLSDSEDEADEDDEDGDALSRGALLGPNTPKGPPARRRRADSLQLRGTRKRQRSFSLSHTLMELDLSGCPSITDDALAYLAPCDEVQTLRLSGCVRITDHGLYVLNALPDLECLDLTACSQVTDKVLSYLSDHTSLRTLVLDSCSNISDVGMRFLGALRALQHLSVCWCPHVTSEGLAHVIPHNPHLQYLGIAHTKIQSARAFKAFLHSTLVELNAAGTRIGDAALHAFAAKCPLVTHLNLRRARCSGLAFLSDSLRHLDLSHTQVTSVQFRTHLPRATHLQVLSVESCPAFDDAALDAALQLPHLRELNAADSSVRDSALERMRRGEHCAPSLRALNLSSTSVGESGVAAVCAAAEQLRELALDSPEITDRHMRYVAQLAELRMLNIFGCHVSDRGLRRLAEHGLPHLRHLEVCSGRITNAGLAVIADSFPELETLNVSQNRRIDDTGMESLRHLRQLCHLNLSRTSVTHRGVAVIRAMPMMRSVSLFGCEHVRRSSKRLQKLQTCNGVLVSTDDEQVQVIVTSVTASPDAS